MASDASAERHANTVGLLTALRADEGRRLAELAQLTGLSRPTVDSILTELSRLGWVEQREPAGEPGAARQAGRPARTYRLNPDAGFVVGVDVGVNLLTAMVADITGTTRITAGRPISRTTSGAERRTAVQSLIADTVAEVGVEPREMLALSLGVPGIVDPSGRVTLSTVIPDWTGFHVEKDFHRWSGVPVTVSNDANMATLAEHWIGAARLVDDVIYVLAGRRTSAGIIIDGRLHTGRHGAAGEIGSIPSLYFSTEELLVPPGRGPESPDAIGAVFRAAADGDQRSVELVEEFYRRLAGVVDVMVKSFDPDMVVLGGGVSRAGQPLVDGVERHLDRPPFNTTPIVLSRLGPEAVALGAVRSALQLAVRHSPLIAALVSPPLQSSSPRPVRGGSG